MNYDIAKAYPFAMRPPSGFEVWRARRVTVVYKDGSDGVEHERRIHCLECGMNTIDVVCIYQGCAQCNSKNFRTEYFPDKS